MVALLFFLLRLLVAPFRSIRRLEAENAALRRQLIVLQRQVRGRVQFTNSDRLFFLQLSVVSIDREGDDDRPARDAGAMASCELPPLAGNPATWEAGHQSMRVYGR